MQIIFEHAIPFILVLFRLAGLFIVSPLLSSTAIPMRFKFLITMMLAAVIYPVLPRELQTPPTMDVGVLLPMVVAEALIGFVLGTLASVPLLCLEASGTLMGQQMGFGLARVYNPEMDAEVDLIGQLMFWLGFGGFLAMGGLGQLIGAIVYTFQRVPIGGGSLIVAPLDGFAALLQSGLELSLRVSAPVTAIVLLLVIVFAVIGKTMPQMNVMNIAFTFKVAAGVGIIALSTFSIATAAGDEMSRAMRFANRWVSELEPRRTVLMEVPHTAN